MKQMLCACLVALALLGVGHISPAMAQVKTDQAQQYTCPMHPHYISTDPDGSCPICGMDLVAAAGSSGSAKGDGSIAVAPEMIQTMGVRTALVRQEEFGRTLRLFGTVQPDQRLETTAISRLEGWVKDLRVRAAGDSVAAGDLLYRVYSPDVLSAQKDYLNALKVGNAARMNVARQRLLSLGLQATVFEQIKTTKQPMEEIPVYAETAGLISALSVREGAYLKPGTPILRLQSYDQVWVIADVPEQDLHLIQVGQDASLRFSSIASTAQMVRVDYLYPTIDATTRTGQMRVVLDNPAGNLRPGAYADINVDVDRALRLAVPTQALLRDSRGSHVILALGGGRFASRMVQTGLEANGYSEILSGLNSGASVVTSGQFMLDSEANLQEGFAKLGTQPLAPDTPLNQLPVDAVALAQIDHFTDMALYFHEALIDGYAIDPAYLDPAIAIGTALQRTFARSKLGPIIDAAQAALLQAKSADSPEQPLADLMTALEPWLLQGAPSHYQQAGLTLYRDVSTQHLWLERSTQPANPYGGGAAEAVDWPIQIQSMETRPAIDPHAGHR